MQEQAEKDELKRQAKLDLEKKIRDEKLGCFERIAVTGGKAFDPNELLKPIDSKKVSPRLTPKISPKMSPRRQSPAFPVTMGSEDEEI